jgi:hypothetical protein
MPGQLHSLATVSGSQRGLVNLSEIGRLRHERPLLSFSITDSPRAGALGTRMHGGSRALHCSSRLQGAGADPLSLGTGGMVRSRLGGELCEVSEVALLAGDGVYQAEGEG